jgi:tRNA1(Val) A37 N6-methylase TrmN6
VTSSQKMQNPALERRRAELEAELGEPITVDGLTRGAGRAYSIFQRRQGHRHSTDDLLTAWYALDVLGETSTRITRCLDLGTGIGSVGLAVLSGLSDDAKLTCIEAQEVSFNLLMENVRANGLEARTMAIRGDLRDLARGERFPLVTGSPPYFPARAGILPADSQKAHARVELRGDVRDYARAARRHLDTTGVFVFCFPWPERRRALEAIDEVGLGAVQFRHVVPREGLAPLFSLYACKDGPPRRDEGPPFVVRTAAGDHTSAMCAVRARFGW